MDRVQPKRVDRFRSESATQQLQTDRAAVAFFATPDDAVAGAHFGQWNATSRTKKFSIHAGMMSQTKRVVDHATGGASLSLPAAAGEPCSVAAAVSAAKEHATRVPSQKCPKWATRGQTLSTIAPQMYHSRSGSQISPLHYRLVARRVSDWPFPRNFIK